jgi:hypothetical protein
MVLALEQTTYQLSTELKKDMPMISPTVAKLKLTPAQIFA